MVGTTLKTMDERIKFIARLPRSIVLLKAPVSRLQIKFTGQEIIMEVTAPKGERN